MKRPNNSKSYGRMQIGGAQICPDGMEYNPITGQCEVPSMGTGQTQYFQTGFTEDGFGQKQSIAYDPMNSTYNEAAKAEQFSTTNPLAAQKTPEKPKIDPYFVLRGAKTGMSWLSGMVERGRQNQYDYRQQTALGQMNPMPASDFQPNPYSLYAKYGGNLKTIKKDFERWSNDAKMDLGSGDDDKGMMKKGGYELDFQMIMQKIVPRLLRMGKLGSNKYQAGGRTPIVVNDKNDPRLRAYNDSLNLYNANNLYNQEASNILKTSKTDGEYSTRMGFNSGNIPNPTGILGKAHNEINKILNNHRKWEPISNIDPGYKIWPDGTKRYLLNTLEYKKPVQSVVFQKQPEEKKLTKPSAIPRQKLNFQTGMRPTPDAPPNFQVAQFDNTKPTKYSFSYPTGKYNEQKRVYFPDAASWKEFISNQKLINSDEGQGYGTATGYLKKGGLTPNKAREILHDNLAQGKPLTDKQRRFFGAKSKGHTNFRGK